MKERVRKRGRSGAERGAVPPAPVVPAPGAPAASEQFILVALGLTAAARVAGCFLPTGWLWGIDTFQYWPPPGQALLIALACAGFVPLVARQIDHLLERAGRAWEKAAVAGDLAASAVVAIMLFTLSDPVRFTGDSMMRAGLINIPAAAAGRLIDFYFPLDIAFNLRLPRLLMERGMSPAMALQLVGAIVGGAYALVSIRVLRALGARGAALAAGGVVVLGAGTLVHFAGYDKFGPLMLGIALAAWGAVRLSRTGKGLTLLTAGTAMAVLSHRSGYFIVPAASWALARSWRAQRNSRARAAVGIAAALMLVVAAVMLPRTIDFVTKVDLAVHLPGGAGARSREATGMPVPLTKLVHVLNAIAFLVPLSFAGLAAAWSHRGSREDAPKGVRARLGFSLTPVVALALAGTGALVLAIAPGGGWPRDWDDATGVATVISLASAGALVSAWGRAGVARTAAASSGLALAASIALWGVHANEAISLRRIDSLLEARSMWSDFTHANAYDILGANQLNAGHFERAAAYFGHAIESAPNPRYFHQLGLVHLAMGRLDEAGADFRRSIERSPVVSDPWAGLARVALAQGDTAAAIANADSALIRSRQNAAAIELKRMLGSWRSR